MMSKKRTRTTTEEMTDAAAAPDLSHITPGLRSLAVPISTLTLDPRNARKHGDKNRESIRNSLIKFGQQKPISVGADGIVLAGNGTLTEGIALGWTHIAVVRSELSGAAARAFAIADNRTSELSTWDAEELTQQLEEIADANDADISPADLGFSDDEVAAMMKDLAGTSEKPDSIGRPTRGKVKAEPEDHGPQFKIVITCDDEADQTAKIDEFTSRNFNFRALCA